MDNNQKCFSSSKSVYYYDFWRSCDTEDWSNDAENTALITEINYILTYPHRKHFTCKNICNFFLLYFWSNKCSLKPRSHYTTLSDKATRSHSFQWRAGDFRRQRVIVTGWGVSSDATKFRILQLYANDERLSGATANRKEDGWAHVIVLLSAVDKHTQWKKSRLCFSFIFNLYSYHI